VVVDAMHRREFVRAVLGIVEAVKRVVDRACECSDPEGCEVSCAGGGCVVRTSPFYRPCLVTPDAPWAAGGIRSFRRFHWRFPVLLVVGVVFSVFAAPLARARIFHFALGAFFGGALILVAAVVYLAKRLRDQVPAGALTALSVATVALPAASAVVLANRLPWAVGVAAGLGRAVAFSAPGRVVMAVGSVAGVFYVWKYSVFLPDQTARLDAHIARLEDKVFEDGAREPSLDGSGAMHDGVEEADDAVAGSVAVLEVLLELGGYLMLLFSTSEQTTSTLLALAVAARGPAGDALWRLHVWRHSERPGRHARTVSAEEFHAAGVRTTERELERLRAYLAKNPGVVMNVREENEIRVRRFVAGKPHVGRRPDSDDEDDGGRCVVQ